MKPQVKKILQKFSTQKVDLNIKVKLDTILDEMFDLMNEIDIDVKNASKTIGKFNVTYKEIQKFKETSDAIKKTLRKNGSKLYSKVKESYKIQKEVESVANELGIEPNKINNYREVKVRTKYFDEFAESAFGWETELKNKIDKKIK
jgi:NCAIR mutase (PurE)-related protein